MIGSYVAAECFVLGDAAATELALAAIHWWESVLEGDLSGGLEAGHGRSYTCPDCGTDSFLRWCTLVVS